MARTDRTYIHFVIWYITAKKRPEMERLRSELTDDFERMYRRSGFFSRAKFSAISFNVYYSDKIREQIKLGRIRKSLNALWVNIIFHSSKWEDLSMHEMKDHLMLAMARAVVLAGMRYKLPVSPFEQRSNELRKRLRLDG